MLFNDTSAQFRPFSVLERLLYKIRKCLGKSIACHKNPLKTKKPMNKYYAGRRKLGL